MAHKIYKSSEILEGLREIGRLPSIPDTLRRFEAAWQDPHKHMIELGNIIASDDKISKRLINTANSVLNRGDANVETTAAAVGRLGVIEARNVVHAVSLHEAFHSPRIDPRKFWRHSITAAFAARNIALYMKQRFKWQVDEQLAFLAGLVHEAGTILMMRFFKNEYELVNDHAQSLDDWLHLEQKQLHMSHAVLGAALFQEWQFPPEIIMAVAGHHHPQRVKPEYYQITYVTCLAEGAAWLINEGNGLRDPNPDQTPQYLLDNLEREKLTRDHLAYLAKKAQDESESSSMLGMF